MGLGGIILAAMTAVQQHSFEKLRQPESCSEVL